MQFQGTQAVSGHVFRVERKRGPQWYAKYRLSSGQQVQKRLGPEWPDTGPPSAGYFTRKSAEVALHAILTDARRGTLVAEGKSGATINDAAAEWLRHAEYERGVKQSTLTEYRSIIRTHIGPVFGELSLEAVSGQMVERWSADRLAEARLSRRTINKTLTVLHGILERACHVWGLTSNPLAEIQRYPDRYSGHLDFFSPEEVMAIVHAAESEQDGVIFLTAAFTGLRRGELIALRWRDVVHEQKSIRVRASYTYGALSTPKSGKARAVPMAAPVSQALAKLAERASYVEDDDLVFPGPGGGYLDGSGLTRRYKAALKRAGLRELRFHDLRHCFGSLAINALSIVEVQQAMGHADVKTTMRYLHAKSRGDEARRLAAAFEIEEPSGVA